MQVFHTRAGNTLRKNLRPQIARIITDTSLSKNLSLQIRGLGLMLGLDIDSPDTAKAAVQYLLDRGILINRTHDTVLRFLPPFIIKKKHVDQVVSALDFALSACSSAAKSTSKTRKRKGN